MRLFKIYFSYKEGTITERMGIGRLLMRFCRTAEEVSSTISRWKSGANELELLFVATPLTLINLVQIIHLHRYWSLLKKQYPPQASHFTAVDYFKKGIKRDQDKFPILKENNTKITGTNPLRCNAECKIWKIWLSLKPNQWTLIREKCLNWSKKIYAVLHNKVQTTQDRAIVCKHLKDSNAQAAYQEFLDHHWGSIAADISTEAIKHTWQQPRLANENSSKPLMPRICFLSLAFNKFQ